MSKTGVERQFELADPVVSTPLENGADVTLENGATRPGWMGDIYEGLGDDQAACRGGCSSAAGGS